MTFSPEEGAELIAALTNTVTLPANASITIAATKIREQNRVLWLRVVTFIAIFL